MTLLMKEIMKKNDDMINEVKKNRKERKKDTP